MFGGKKGTGNLVWVMVGGLFLPMAGADKCYSGQRENWVCHAPGEGAVIGFDGAGNLA